MIIASGTLLSAKKTAFNHLPPRKMSFRAKSGLNFYNPLMYFYMNLISTLPVRLHFPITLTFGATRQLTVKPLVKLGLILKRRRCPATGVTLLIKFVLE